ncbi:MAG: ribosomal RNA small subunit methyltransferase A [Deltaproteobacteria bacterium]|nr:ribosomal RNA small subunit methyltransferase A [Deltaproteobacteria bacterium]MBW2150804.1 ribosomal RNA small subunit methyltransferase A [Deltaproteobacteria bacterium]
MISPRSLLKASNLRPKKKLGQHFLTEMATGESIVSASKIDKEDIVLEIGAGLGALTVPLARVTKRVYAVEVDFSIVPLLETVFNSYGIKNVTIIDKDFLKVDLGEIARDENRRLTIIGNLPYNISSQIIIKLISSRHLINRCILMFQKELAQRIASLPGSKTYGRISVMLQYYATIRPIKEIDASCFYPKPKVNSEVLEIIFKNASLLKARNEAIFSQVVKASFSKRRKTIKNALTGSLLFGKADDAKKILENAGIDSTRRAETLSIEEFVKLSNVVAQSGKKPNFTENCLRS